MRLKLDDNTQKCSYRIWFCDWPSFISIGIAILQILNKNYGFVLAQYFMLDWLAESNKCTCNTCPAKGYFVVNICLKNISESMFVKSLIHEEK